MKSVKLVVIAAVSFACVASLLADTATVTPPQKIDSAVLPNTYRLTEKVLSGGQPQGEPAFAQLQQLGVKTVISVDGATPDVQAAKKYGLRYVHLPHGYDGIPKERLTELTKAIRDLPGPIYIHCHHGKHRSPAAAAAACVSAGTMTHDQALAVLAAAGTSSGYRGLFDAVKKATPIDSQTLDALQVEFRETADIPPMADAMIEIEHTFDHLKLIAAAGWKATAKHADIDPPHEALLLREHFTELLRTDEAKNQPEEFQALLRQSEADAHKLEDGLRAAPANTVELNRHFASLTAGCTSCHQKFRDVPLDERTPLDERAATQ